MSRLLLALLFAALLSGCATPSPREMPRELDVPFAPDATLRASAQVLMANGYVVRHADAELGRLEAVFSRWPGYRVRVAVSGEGEQSRVSLAATRGGRPMPPQTLDRLLVELQEQLGRGR
ncbi:MULTISPECIES: hypothetical protein [Halomonas]|jgi:hypothetical protein|uniref:hypothetical protein n=1 Tax=Halomonas TaxID=2745 RepID=UPI0020B6FCBF|nr:hypothetical protein [Halomonas sp. 3H]